MFYIASERSLVLDGVADEALEARSANGGS